MNEHRLGIIGGMGPQATNTFTSISLTAPTPTATRAPVRSDLFG